MSPPADTPYLDPMQLVDELSMIYTTCLMCFATFSYRRSALWTTALGLGLAALSWFITVCSVEAPSDVTR